MCHFLSINQRTDIQFLDQGTIQTTEKHTFRMTGLKFGTSVELSSFGEESTSTVSQLVSRNA
jgi:hypothetical protein